MDLYPEILSGDAGNQIEAVWRYVSLPKPRPPVGLGNDPIELVAGDKPVIYRNFIEGAGARAIGVGFPERVNLAWDAESFRLALVWKGSFIDARRHWTGRGEGFQPPMGDGIYTPDAAACVAILSAPDAPWPAEPPRKRGGRFGGYSLDARGQPTFRWSLPDEGLAVSESFAGATDPMLVRTVTVSSRGSLAGAVYRVARGDSIEEEADGWWRVDRFWRVRVGGAGAGKTFRVERDGKQELRVALDPGPGADGVAIVEELSW